MRVVNLKYFKEYFGFNNFKKNWRNCHPDIKKKIENEFQLFHKKYLSFKLLSTSYSLCYMLHVKLHSATTMKSNFHLK